MFHHLWSSPLLLVREQHRPPLPQHQQDLHRLRPRPQVLCLHLQPTSHPNDNLDPSKDENLCESILSGGDPFPPEPCPRPLWGGGELQFPGAPIWQKSNIFVFVRDSNPPSGMYKKESVDEDRMSPSLGRLEWSEDCNMFTSQPIHVNRNPVLCIFSAYMHMHGMLNVQEIWICIFWPRTFGDRWDCQVNWVHEALQIQVYQEHEKPEQIKMLKIIGSSKKWGNQPGSSSLRKTRRVSNCGWWAGKRLLRFVFLPM